MSKKCSTNAETCPVNRDSVVLGTNLLVWGITVSDVEDPSVKTLVLQHLQGIVLYFLVNGYTLYRDGQFLGKKVLRIRIVRGNGEKATFGRILGLRYLPCGPSASSLSSDRWWG